jgi:hypothetical protein
LQIVDLSKNPLCGPNLEGILSLKEALINSSLKSLNLSDTNLMTRGNCEDESHVKGAILIAEALGESHHLKTLDISYNPLDVSALNAIASSIKRNSGIEHFYISPILQQSTIQMEVLDQIISKIYSYMQKNKRRSLQEDMANADQTVQVLEEMIDETKRLSLTGDKRTASQEELLGYLRRECTRFKEELGHIINGEEIKDPQLRSKIHSLYNHLEKATSNYWQLQPPSHIKHDQFSNIEPVNTNPLLGMLDLQVIFLTH